MDHNENRDRELRKLLVNKKLGLLAEVKKDMGDKLEEDVRLSFDILR